VAARGRGVSAVRLPRAPRVWAVAAVRRAAPASRVRVRSGKAATNAPVCLCAARCCHAAAEEAKPGLRNEEDVEKLRQEALDKLETPLEKMKIKDLKKLLQERGVTCKACSEKAQLLASGTPPSPAVRACGPVACVLVCLCMRRAPARAWALSCTAARFVICRSMSVRTDI